MANRFDTYKCENCDATTDKEIADSKDADNHTNVTHIENAKTQSCTETGYTGDTVCECGVTLEYGTEISMDAHTYTVYVDVATPATCMANRFDTYKCANCDATTGIEIADTKNPANHTGNTHIENAEVASCTKDGYTGDTVCECGETLETGSVIPMGEHNYSVYVDVYSVASCISDRYDTYKCSDCDATTNVKIEGTLDPEAHTGNNTYDVGKKAENCDADGYTGDTVCECGAVIVKGEVIPAFAHNYNVYVGVKSEATCVDNRVDTYKCATCSKTTDKVIAGSRDKNNHTLNTTVVNAKEATCAVTGYTGDVECECGTVIEKGTVIGLKAHTFNKWIEDVAPTCTTVGVKGHYVCSVCKANVDAFGDAMPIVIIPPVHSVEYIDEVPATCAKAGVKAHWGCVLCGQMFTDETASKEASAASLTIKKTENHALTLVSEKAPTCTVKGNKTYKCEICGAEKKEWISSTGIHSYELIATEPSTDNQLGYKVYKCTSCDHTFKQYDEDDGSHGSGICPDCDGTMHRSLLGRFICLVRQIIKAIRNLFMGVR